ncbi:MAG TPA: response regulator [Burkholderiales bacterium]|nr:response regulator [Burkholderiales bacterium]
MTSPSPIVNAFPPDAPRTARPRRVLVVEDQIDAVRTLSALIAEMGHDVSYAINGYAALEIARRFRPHVALVDVALPAGMNGHELCARLRQEPKLGPLRLIALTAYGSEEHRARSLAAGCELHLVKPVSAATLFAVLEDPAGP